MAAKIFGTIAEHNIVVDDIIQNVMDDNTANISFTVDHGEMADIAAGRRRPDPGIGRVRRRRSTTMTWPRSAWSASACASTPAWPSAMFTALADAKINIQNITTSEIKISCIINKRGWGQGAATGSRCV